MNYNNIAGFKMAMQLQGNTAPVPEPEAYAMLGVGVALMGWAARRRK